MAPNGAAPTLAVLAAALMTRGAAGAFMWPFGGGSSPSPSPHGQVGPVPGPQPNPPAWPSTVKVFGPQDDPNLITAAVMQAFTVNGGHEPIDHGQFSDQRFAFLFKPGTYHMDIPVGYYTQVLGLGKMPAEVTFDGPRGVYCEEGDQTDMGGSLSTFWRGAENFHHASAGGMLWAVSQAAPVRRVMVDKNLTLAQFVPGVGMGYASGGFLANVQVAGTLNSASQQQWCTRNVGIGGSWQGAVWNMVFIGTTGAPATHCGRDDNGGLPQVSVPETPLISEKPYISIGADGKYSLQVPPTQRARVGPDFSPGRSVPFEKVYVARDTDSAAEINRHLAAGMDVVLSPGIYHLEAPLVVDHDDQVLLGLGLATLVPDEGTFAIRVGNVDGVHIAGVLLQAGEKESEALLQWGDGTHRGDPERPGFLHDLFARVGGPNDPHEVEVRAKVMVNIANGHVVGDNFWLWRADHGVSGIVKRSMNPVQHGLIVTGSHVTMYGLAVEHTLKDLVQWAGDDGAVYFFQSELPYDVTPAFGDAGFVGYRVNDTVKRHRAFGVGVYHYFRDFPVVVPRGIAAPAWLENSFESPLSVSLTGKGHMLHVMNDKGEGTKGDAGVSWVCSKGPAVAPSVGTTAAPRPTSPRPTLPPSATTRPPPAPATTVAVATTTTTLATTPTTPPPAVTTAAPAVTTAAPSVTTVAPAATTVAPVTTRPGTTKPATAITRPTGGQGSCVQPFGKCGGRGWEGASCCVSGFLCQEMGIWYSQCLPRHVSYLSPEDVRSMRQPLATLPPAQAPTTTTPAPAPRACAQTWAKCGGFRWTGPTCCEAGTSCVKQSDWLSECIPGGGRVVTVHDAGERPFYFKKDAEERAPLPRGGSGAGPTGLADVADFLSWALPMALVPVALAAFFLGARLRRVEGLEGMSPGRGFGSPLPLHRPRPLEELSEGPRRHLFVDTP